MLAPWWAATKRAQLTKRLPMHQGEDAQRAKLGQHSMQRLTVVPWWAGIKWARAIRRRPVH
jgi:hypothetical protein